ETYPVSEDSRSPSTGRKLARICLRVVVVAGVLGFILLGVIFPRAVDEVGPRDESMKHLKDIAIAMHGYAEAHDGRLPPAVVTDKDGRPLYSWRVAILPYLSQPGP